MSWRVLLLLLTALSHLSPAQETRTAQNQDPFPTARSKKGLQVQMVDDAIALGVQHAALNCDLAAFMDPRSSSGSIPWVSGGRTFHFQREVVERHDRQIQPLSEAGIHVTLILLSCRSTDAEIEKIIRPASARANTQSPIYGFNVESSEGLAWYRAAVEFLAHRYSSNDKSHGRVVGYIVGNEVNSHYGWYETGDASTEELAIQYERAVRVAHTAIRLASAQARVYLSLDHHWTDRAFQDPLRACAGRELLDSFAKQARAGGDYDWHLAYHPYPAKLGEPRTWLDGGLRDDADTRLITPKNLEVLPKYLQKPELLYQDQPRRIILSEQGFHSPDGPEGERWQAAGFCYTWAKVQQLAGIDAFILHRHVDHPKEGGLHLGLWTSKPNSVAPDRQKLIYEVFRACDTPDWEKVAAPYFDEFTRADSK